MKIIIFFIFFLISVPFSFATDYSNDANCQGYWAMEGATGADESDLSVNSETLTDVSSNVDQVADPKYGTYARGDFLDDNSYFTHADGGSTDISGANQKITLFTFFKPEDTGLFVNEDLFGKWGDPNDQYALYIAGAGDNIVFVVSNDGSNNALEQGTTDVYENVWHSAAGVYDDIDIKVYVDGSQEGAPATAHTTGLYAGSEPFNVGGRNITVQEFDGLLDDTIIFDRELTSVEISDLDTNGVEGGAAAARRMFIVS